MLNSSSRQIGKKVKVWSAEMLDPVIKVRHKTAAVWTTVLVLVLAATGGGEAAAAARGLAKCDKTPLDQQDLTPGDGGFSVRISGSPRLYRPNQLYTITLQGKREDGGSTKFQGFMLVAEHQQSNPAQNPTSLGTFRLVKGDAMTKFSHRCSHSVEATSSISKEKVEVYWTAPERGSGCIKFKAMIVERQDFWFADDGSLTYTLCKDDSPLAEPTQVRDCCACNEAKYEIIFEGIWSRHTHPKDFPKDEWRTQFSKLIGSSHSKSYTLWEYGRQASPALEVLSRHGITQKLEAQMKQFSDQIRSVIKAHGLQQRSNVAGQTFAVFRVDPKHHLLSFVSKMIPSPDWIVGLSKEDLCLPNCTWMANRVIDLYPWDTGIENGFKYDSPIDPTTPRGFIQRITSSNPDDSSSPFWDEQSAPMKPAARLHIIKQREYRSACPNAGRQGLKAERPNEGLNPSWNSGSPGFGSEGASYTYGVGIDQPLENELAYGGEVDEMNQDYEYRSTDNEYTKPDDDYPDYGGDYDSSLNRPDAVGTLDDVCQTTPWSRWSSCSSSCDSGSRSRRRQYVDESLANINRCQEQLFLKEPCHNLPRCETKSYVGTFNPFPADEDEGTMSRYSTPWLERGLESDGLKKAPTSANSNTYESDADTTNTPRHNQIPSSYEYLGAESDPGVRWRKPTFGSSNGNKQNSNDGLTPSPYGNSYLYGGLTLDGEVDAPVHSSYKRLRQEGGSSAEDCDVQEWGEWSDCSSHCDRGIRTRRRTYITPEKSGTCSQELDGREHCTGDGLDCPNRREPVASLGFNYVKPHYQEDEPECELSQWSRWSPCSNNCGSGQRRRTRLYLIPFVEDRSCDVKLFDRESCYGTDTLCSGADDADFEDYGNVDDNALSYVDSDYDEEAVVKDDEFGDDGKDDEDTCAIEKDPGPCRGHYNRWYFDVDETKCKEFVFHGCNGNRNNFPTEEKCLETCWHKLNDSDGDGLFEGGSQVNNDWSSRHHDDLGITWVEGVSDDHELDSSRLVSNFKDLDALSLIKLSPEQESSGSFRPPRIGRPVSIDCQASAWSEWTSCSKSCGVGWSTRKREIMVEANNGGKSCPKKLSRKRKCHQMPCPADTKYWYQGSWRHMVED